MVDPCISLQYRGTSLTLTVDKIYSSPLNVRLLKFCEFKDLLVEEQNEFRKKRSCEEHIFTLTSIIKHILNTKKSTYAAFIDMEKVFDKVDRYLLQLRLLEYDIDGHMFRAVESLCSGFLYSVQINGLLTPWFDAKLGIRQVDCISPTLFALFINDLAHRIKELGLGVQFGESNISILLNADDIVLLAENEENLQMKIYNRFSW
jgi:hypothetical protein